MIEALGYAASQKLPEQAIRFKIAPWRIKSASIPQMNIKSISRMDNPNDSNEARLQELDYLVASGCALPVKITDIKGGPKKSENLFFRNRKKGDTVYPEYAVSVVNRISQPPVDHFVDSRKGQLPSPIMVAVIEKDVFTTNKTNDSNGVESVFDPVKITTEMLTSHKKAQKRASKPNT